MNTLREYIESGILELYVMGMLAEEERAEVEKMASAHEEVRREMNEISVALEQYAHEQGVDPNPTIKPLLMATIDYTERLTNGEPPSFPPVLTADSKISDYSEWLDRPDMTLPADFNEFHAKIIGYTPEAQTVVAWIKTMAPHEVHDNEYEQFLILEGSCDIIVEGKVHSLEAGDYMRIPLHAGHHVKITSMIPCKVILQRIAA